MLLDLRLAKPGARNVRRTYVPPRGASGGGQAVLWAPQVLFAGRAVRVGAGAGDVQVPAVAAAGVKGSLGGGASLNALIGSVSGVSSFAARRIDQRHEDEQLLLSLI